MRRETERSDEAQPSPDATHIERDRLAAALADLRHGVVVIDADGQEVFRNRAAERYRDPRLADAVAAGVITDLLEQARSGRAIERELQLFGPPRSVLQLQAIPLRAGEQPLGAAVIVYDVSEIHRVDSVRRDFVANVSHELKTPIGALEILAETLASETDPLVVRHMAELVVKEAERLGQIVDDLLDLSLIETQEAPRREPIPVGVLLDDALDRVQRASDAAGIGIEVVNNATSSTVACDRRQMVSALANLLENAVKYSERDGEVSLSATVDGPTLVLTVADEGIGIPHRDLERIFERFYRVDHARSRDTGGTGLGLAIVRHVVRAHGGDVSVESVEGQGSTFRVTLPLETVDPRAAPRQGGG